MESTILNNVSPQDLKKLLGDAVEDKISSILEKFTTNSGDEKLLTRNEVCALLEINLSTLHRWRISGKIKAYGIAGKVYFKKSEIEAALIPLT